MRLDDAVAAFHARHGVTHGQPATPAPTAAELAAAAERDRLAKQAAEQQATADAWRKVVTAANRSRGFTD